MREGSESTQDGVLPASPASPWHYLPARRPVGTCRAILPPPYPSRASPCQPSTIYVDGSIEAEPLLEEVGGLHVALVGDDPQDHDWCGELGQHHNDDLLRILKKPSVVLPIHLLILLEILFIWKKNQSGALPVLLTHVLHLIEQPLCLLDPSGLGLLRHELPLVHLMAPVADVLL